MTYDEEKEEKRQERQHRRQVISEWKAAAKALMDSADKNNIVMLMKEARAEALRIIEDAARTQEDFEKVLQIWDETEIIEDWRIGKHEEKYDAKLPNRELSSLDIIYPQPFDHVWWRQMLGGSFIDVIHDCPHEMHELTSSRPVHDFINELDESHKEILYYWVIRQWSAQRIAALRGQTDRNIRKVYNNMIADIRRKMYIRLYPRYEKGEPLTFAQREFVEQYWELLDELEKDRLSKKTEEEEYRGRTKK